MSNYKEAFLVTKQQSPFDISIPAGFNKNTSPAILSIGSGDRNTDLYTTPNKYSITLPVPYKNVVAIELVNASVPKNSYTLTSTNNKLHFKEASDGLLLSASVHVGTYTATQLADALETALNSATSTGSVYSVNVEQNTNRFVIEQASGSGYLKLFFAGTAKRYGNSHFSGQQYTGQTLIPYRDESIGKVLGFGRRDYSGQTEYVSDFPYNLQPDKMICLKIKGMERVDSTNPNFQGAFCVIPFSDDSFTYNNEGPQNDQYIKTFSEPIPDLREMAIEFVDREGALYDFNGGEHTLVFKITSLTRAGQYVA
jgi:hypothetical protein